MAKNAKTTKTALIGSRAWRLLRLALLWARKGGAFKRGLFVHHLRLAPGFFKSLKPGRRDQLRYGEREFSIEETPAFKFKTPSMRMLCIPCITPADDFDCDDDQRFFFQRDSERHFIDYDAEPRDAQEDDDDDDDDDDDNNVGTQEIVQEQEMLQQLARTSRADLIDGDGEGSVDEKAEEFIAKFYAQMKLQRQISWLRYHEMLERSIS